jgi:hypothetical protein
VQQSLLAFPHYAMRPVSGSRQDVGFPALPLLRLVFRRHGEQLRQTDFQADRFLTTGYYAGAYNKSTADMNVGAAFGVLLRLAQHLMCDRGSISLAKGYILEQI